ncbi:DNA-3-methyladenine glycosylase [Maribellus sediminis]|uniref:DNA-3-methyladenine glycosylase n=1 Tax=Maribellus sediminis TaxID=2696285 RepID=UPI0014312826|nr:DNA-3-methyladenine glycosylase [Maribellus sediminis]
MSYRLPPQFFQHDVLEVAPALLGKILVRQFENGSIQQFTITEVEAYRGTEDIACHASKGRTARTEVMFHEGGVVYVYLIYGMYWMLNIVTGRENDASAVLIRGLKGISGPGRVGKALQLDKSFYGEDLSTSKRLWIEDTGIKPEYITTPRIGITYAGEPWASKPWRYVMKE